MQNNIVLPSRLAKVIYVTSLEQFTTVGFQKKYINFSL